MMLERDLNRHWLIRDKYNGEENAVGFEGDIKRLERGEPIDYVIGSRPFLGARIDLSYKPLIPREATEYWVEKAILEVKVLSSEKKLRILDLFAGSGAIGIALLKNLENAEVHFGEIDERFIKQIHLNLEINNVASARTKVFETDVFGGVSRKYDYIFANPPYLALQKLSEVQKSVLDFEPRKALFGGDDGMYFLEKFFAEAGRFLLPRGMIYFEFHSPQKEVLENMLGELGYDFELDKDQFDLYRWGTARLRN